MAYKDSKTDFSLDFQGFFLKNKAFLERCVFILKYQLFVYQLFMLNFFTVIRINTVSI